MRKDFLLIFIMLSLTVSALGCSNIKGAGEGMGSASPTIQETVGHNND